MEIGINVDLLENIIKNKKKNKIEKQEKEEKLYSKIGEYSFFIQNELAVSEIINKNLTVPEKNGFFRYLTVEEHNFIKIGETYEDNTNFLSNNLNNKYVILKYKFIENLNNKTFINSFIDYENKSIFWNLINIYEHFIQNFLFLNETREKKINLLDFSPKNLLYDDKSGCIFMRNFKKCYINDGNLDNFITIINSIEYFGNKHFEIYLAREIIDKKDLLVIWNNLDTILDEYIQNLYFFKFFSQKIKNEIKNNWIKIIKTNPVFERNNEMTHIFATNDWKTFLSLFLTYSQINNSVWETFSVNCLFLNITISLVKFFKIEDKNSILHKYIQFLFNNLDLKNNLSMLLNREKYAVFINSIQKDFHCNNYNLTILKNCPFIEENELLEYLTSNIDFF
jgi:hypothetical protein